jgi:hypothetical protein
MPDRFVSPSRGGTVAEDGSKDRRCLCRRCEGRKECRISAWMERGGDDSDQGTSLHGGQDPDDDTGRPGIVQPRACRERLAPSTVPPLRRSGSVARRMPALGRGSSLETWKNSGRGRETFRRVGLGAGLAIGMGVGVALGAGAAQHGHRDRPRLRVGAAVMVLFTWAGTRMQREEQRRAPKPEAPPRRKRWTTPAPTARAPTPTLRATARPSAPRRHG